MSDFTVELGALRTDATTFDDLADFFVGMVDEEPEQTLLHVQVGKPSRWGEMQDPEPVSVLDPVSISELVRDLELLCE